MTRLILTTSDSGAGCLRQTGVADAVLPFGHRFVGRLPSEAELADSLMALSSQHEQSDDDWLLRIYTLGQEVLAGREDFSRHNPVHRWWGGTELSNDRLWRWDATRQILIEP